MHSALLALAALLSSPTVSEDIAIDGGRPDRNAFPEARLSTSELPVGAMVGRVERMLRERECELPGQRPARFDVTVPWLVQLEANGQVSRLVVADMGCRPLEVYVASLVVDLARQGRLSGEEGRPGWYGSNFNFTLSTAR